MLLEARNISKLFGQLRALDGVSMSVSEGEVLGLIGPNGAGKSTFFNCLAGDFPPTEGTVTFEGRDITQSTPEERALIGLARTFQLPETFKGMTVLENVMIGAFLRTNHRGEAQDRAFEVLRQVDMEDLADTPARILGTPGQKRLEIARALATEPKVLLLDEVMAGLTPTEVRRAIELVQAIHETGIVLIVVEHILEVIHSLARNVIVFHQGRVIAEGSPREVTADPLVIEAYLGKRASRQQGAALS